MCVDNFHKHTSYLNGNLIKKKINTLDDDYVSLFFKVHVFRAKDSIDRSKKKLNFYSNDSLCPKLPKLDLHKFYLKYNYIFGLNYIVWGFFMLTYGNLFENIVIYLNGILVWNATYEDGTAGTGDQPLPMVIPPHTHFEGQLSSAGADNMAMTVAGRVYKQ